MLKLILRLLCWGSGHVAGTKKLASGPTRKSGCIRCKRVKFVSYVNLLGDDKVGIDVGKVDGEYSAFKVFLGNKR